MTKEKTTLSLRRMILLIFIISLFISVACYGVLIFTQWVSSARKATAHMAADINEEIYNRVDTFMQVPYLHDIGKIILDDGILTKDTLSDEEMEKMQQHSAVGYRILSLFDDTLDLAEYVYGHHERWDGTGYPRRLKGEQITLLSRIITVVETYDRVMNRGELSLGERKIASLNVIKNGSGTQFDPLIAELFVQIAEKSEEI